MKAPRLIPLVVVAAGLLAWHNSFTGPFVFDDEDSIQANPTIRHVWPISQALSPPTTVGVGGRPVLNLSLAVNYALGGYDVWGYHAVNLAIHILAGLTLWGIVRRTLRLPKLRERFGPTANELALTVSVLWIVHPVQTEAVTYVSQRAESLMGLFYLLTLYCFIRGTASPKVGRWFALSAGACLLGMATKEVMVTAPLMVLLYDRTFVAGSFRTAWTQRRPLYVGLGSTWLLLAYLMLGLHHRGVGYGLGVDWQVYALTECRSIVHYLRLAIWPHPLVFDYGGNTFVWHATDAAPYALILLLSLAGVVIGLKRWPAIGFVGAWFFMVLAPTSTVVPIVNQPMAESRLYLPLAAVVVAAVMGIFALAGRRSLPVFLGLAVGLGFLTTQRNQDYRSGLAIWSDTVAKRPDNARAHSNLGNALMDAGQAAEAVVQCKEAVRIKPDYPEAYNNWGNALEMMGNVQEPIGLYEQALRIKPDYAKARYNLAVALVRVDRVPEAIGQFEQALRDSPEYPEAHCHLGMALSQVGKIQEAIGQYQQALRIKPDYAEAHANMGLALEQTGRLREAIEYYEQASRIAPKHLEIQNHLAWLLATLTPSDGGYPERAVSLAEHICNATGNQATPYLDTLAAAYAAVGRFNEAIDTAQKAMDLANAADLPQLAKQIESRLQLYRSGQAYHRAAPATSPNP